MRNDIEFTDSGEIRKIIQQSAFSNMQWLFQMFQIIDFLIL